MLLRCCQHCLLCQMCSTELPTIPPTPGHQRSEASTGIGDEAGVLFYKGSGEFATPCCGLQGSRGIERDRTSQKGSSASQRFEGREVGNADALQLWACFSTNKTYTANRQMYVSFISGEGKAEWNSYRNILACATLALPVNTPHCSRFLLIGQVCHILGNISSSTYTFWLCEKMKGWVRVSQA